MLKNLSTILLCSAFIFGACGGDDDDNGDGPTTAATYEITLTNKTTGQLMTPPVVAIHSTDVHLFEVGELASANVVDIAETGDNAGLVAFASDAANSASISASGVAGAAPLAANEAATIMLTSAEAGQVFSAVNMLICTNDGIAGFDSVALPLDATPVTYLAKPYDAGSRVNQIDHNSFFPGPCRDQDGVGDPVAVVEAPLEDPQAVIGAHAGQAGITVHAGAPAGANWDFLTADDVLEVVITRQ